MYALALTLFTPYFHNRQHYDQLKMSLLWLFPVWAMLQYSFRLHSLLLCQLSETVCCDIICLCNNFIYIVVNLAYMEENKLRYIGMTNKTKINNPSFFQQQKLQGVIFQDFKMGHMTWQNSITLGELLSIPTIIVCTSLIQVITVLG